MDNVDKNKIRNAFDSILRADYLSPNRIEDLSNLSDYYVDTFNSISNILQKQDNFISGRRGTGKTTALFKAYYECLKTISTKESSEYFSDEKILPIYIDLSTSSDLFNKTNLDLLEIHFVRIIISSLKKQIESVFDKSFIKKFRKENPALEGLEEIERMLVEGVTVSVTKHRKINQKKKSQGSLEIGSEASVSNAKITSSLSSDSSNSVNEEYGKTKGLNIQEFLSKIHDITIKAKIDYVFLFLDEFSDLNDEEQGRLSGVIKSLLGSKNNIFIKIGVITDRYDFGEKIILGRDIFPIPLDLNEHVERLGGLSHSLIRFEDSISELINKRLQAYNVNLTFDDLLKSNKNEIISRIARESIAVPRTLGLILQNAWKQAEISPQNKIGLKEINYGIRSTRKTYFKQYEGAVRKKILAGFYNDMWHAIINRALKEKTKNPDRPASHFMIDPKRKNYLNIFQENFMIHLLEEGRASKYGGHYNLYAIDYDICLDLNIKYAENKDEYSAIRFVYDEVLSDFDCYFIDEQSKSYKCSICGSLYKEDEVSRAKIKRCFEDDNILTEIIHQEFEVTHGNLAEVEVKILGLISMLSEDESMSAVEICNSVGCTRQKVSAWCSRVLEPRGDISIHKKHDKNYYFSSLD